MTSTQLPRWAAVAHWHPIGLFLKSPLIVVFALALIIRLVYFASTQGTPLAYWEAWEQSDMDTFLHVAGQILKGDILVSTPYHPYHAWQREIASAEQWDIWYGPHTFLQLPGYYYFLALMLKISAGAYGPIKLFQACLGAVHATILTALARRIFGTTGAILTGLLAAMYGPFVVIESLLLREGPALLLSTSTVLLAVSLFEFETKEGRNHVWHWIVLGAIAGLGALLKETGIVLCVAILTWILAGKFLNQRQFVAKQAILFLIGFGAVMSPLIIRNIVVGAPFIPLSPPAVINFIVANAADSPSDGILFEIPPSFSTIMNESHGKMAPTVVATLGHYGERPWALFSNLLGRFSAIWSNIEVRDNFSYEYFAMNNVPLTLLPRFVCIWIPALAGSAMLLHSWSILRPSQRSAFGLILTIMAFHVAAQSFAPVVSRYRMVIVPYLMLLAGWGASQLVEHCREHRRASAMLWTASVPFIFLLWYLWPMNPALSRGAIAPVDFYVGAQLSAKTGDLSRARREFEKGLDYFRSHGDLAQEILLRRERLVYFTMAGRFQDVQEDWHLLRQILPGQDPALRWVWKTMIQSGGPNPMSVIPETSDTRNPRNLNSRAHP